jgi:hypothetical protein
MRKVLRSGALVLIGMAASVAPVLTATAASPAVAGAAPASKAHFVPGIYHNPIIGKTTLPGVGSVLGVGSHGLRHATAVSSANWSGYADTNETYNSVAANWTEPAVSCQANLGGLLGGPSAASSFWVGLDGYNSTSVEQLGTDSDCNGGKPNYYAWWEMYPNPSVTLSAPDTVTPGDQMTAWVVWTGTQFQLSMKDTTKGWSFSTTQSGSFARSSAEVIAEAPESCTLIFCHELQLANFNQVSFSGASVYNSAGTSGTLSTFPASEITMASNTGTVKAQPSNLSTDGSAFTVTWKHS